MYWVMGMEVGFEVKRVFGKAYILELEEPLGLTVGFMDVVVMIGGRSYEATYYVSSRPRIVVISGDRIPSRAKLRLVGICGDCYD